MAVNTYNRELSWLQFNDRVLQEAQDGSVPLLQRLRFLGIFSNNQDEFIKVRYARLLNYDSLKSTRSTKLTGGYIPSQLIPQMNQRMDISQEIFHSTYRDIMAQMELKGIYMVTEKELNSEQMAFCREYFLSVVSVRLAPIILRKRDKLPSLPDSEAYLAVKMSSAKSTRYAVVQVPVSDASPRFVVLPSQEGRVDIIFLDDIIRLFLDDIFFMFSYDTISAHLFKIIRDGSLTLDDDASKSLTEKMNKGISRRERGRVVRMVHDREMPLDLLETISGKLGSMTPDQIDSGGRYHLMRDLMDFPRVCPALESSRPKPMLHPLIDPSESILKVIKQQDILLAYPYHTFNHFIDLLREAAIDPLVHSISITLYRTASHSKVINSLLNAVKNGKQVTVLVELKARFDEERNIDNTETLQRGGVRVIPAQSMLKVHSKLVLIERREGNTMRGYTYVGTGNFNEKTATIYSDFGVLTANPVIANDARKIFSFLDNTHLHTECKKLLVSPYDMRERIAEMINAEIRNAQKGKKAKFYGKFNSLTDEKMIGLLYKASQAGVKIRLLIRGACCLQAGVKGLSENIEVRSIVDKFLEHARVMIFAGGGRPQTYILSADLMTRNLDRRVEVGIQITDPAIERSIKEYFLIQWRDNVKSRKITQPYENRYVVNGSEPCRSQDELYAYFENQLKG